MGKFWEPRWEQKWKRLGAMGEDFRQDPILMDGIQSHFTREDILRWSRVCAEARVPEEFWADSPVGRPQVYKIHGLECNPGSLRHAYTAHRIRAFSKAKHLGTVVEIGGGYGGLARALFQRFSIEQYLLVDSAACLAIQRRFLEGAGLARSCRFLLPEDLQDETEAQLVVNSNSFGEMDPLEVEAYFEILHEIVLEGGGLYSVNRIKRETSLSQYPFDDRWDFQLGRWLDDDAWFELWATRTAQGRGNGRSSFTAPRT